MRLDLAEGCPRIPAPSIHEHCGVIYPDLAAAPRPTDQVERVPGKNPASPAAKRDAEGFDWGR
jgi:hypothetical protein